MTLDSSALLAVLLSEPGYLDLVDRMLEAEVLRIGTPTLVETGVVFATRRGSGAAAPGRQVDAVHELITEMGVTVVPFGEAESRRAVEAFIRFGRGRHKANLNFGDCLAYATAAVANDTLLYVGNDFRHTDIAPAR